ncbi:low-density lipoprotein receptor-related protein 11-like isoform X2 [Octopus vulgaris]|uniref:Low-density lipoprotein receptor-related protein 11-like isoform X2 n=1 Tax=Octopus vulgaris TaxID=6645 RepID=A0AA36F4C4_OCTVU|nr:low-density lipoprotein receptor-related protein 11-like isoform X2 [Octopus vulgaris]
MMKPLFIFPCIFLYCLASEFIAEDFEQGPSIAIRLSKRLERSKRGQQDLLQNSDDAQSETQTPTKQADNLRGNIKTPDRDNSGTLSVSGSQAEHGVCYYNKNTSVIIKTNSSLTAGAKFMKYAQAVNSMDCAKKCCDTKGCNEAIFENKKDHSCYLFDCGNPSVCVFAPHNSYISMNFQQIKNKVETSHAHLAIKHESELAGLDNQGSSKDSIVQSTTTTTTTTTHTTFQPTTLKKRTKIVSLDDVCTPADECEDKHAECIQEKCRCQEGYIIKYGICRKQCDKHHFECEERGSKSIGVECIELANVCDGVPQCGDGSDEFGCSSNDNGRVNQDLHNLGNGNRPSDNIKQIHPNGVQVHYQATENKIRGNQQQQPNLGKNMSPDVRPDAQDHPKTRFHTESKMQAANTNTDYKAETDGTVHSNAASTDNDNKDKVNGKSENDPVVASSKESTTTRSTTLHQNNSVTQKPIKSAAKFFEHSNYILKKKVVVASPSDNAQGPIVALALGLSFTTMLLIFVGCRLHRVKRRLRKGRALHSNEADYLINGMYL